MTLLEAIRRLLRNYLPDGAIVPDGRRHAPGRRHDRRHPGPGRRGVAVLAVGVFVVSALLVSVGHDLVATFTALWSLAPPLVVTAPLLCLCGALCHERVRSLLARLPSRAPPLAGTLIPA